MLARFPTEFRAWEYDYLTWAAQNCPPQGSLSRVPGMRRPKVESEANIVSADPVRPFAAVPGLDGKLRIVDLSDFDAVVAGTPKVTVAFSSDHQLIFGSYSGDGSTYAVGDERGSVFVWRTKDATEPESFSIDSKAVVEVALDRTGTRMVTETYRGEVALWDVPTKRQIRVLGSSFRYGRPIEFSPDGKVIALGGMESIEMFSADTGEKLRDIGPHGHYVMNLAFSPDGKLLASGTRGSIPKSVALFDVESGRKVAEFNGHSTGITGLTFSPHGERLVSTSGDGTLRILHVPTCVELLRISIGAPFGDPQFTSDGGTILWSGERGLELISLPRSSK
jgi:WD40 repeat protein